MQIPTITIGIAIVTVGMLGPEAIADESQGALRSMSNLELPTVEVDRSSHAVTNAPLLSDILPESDFADVPPTHWAYGAVNSLAENYGCLAGYPDETFRGDQFVTRYEFAAAMENCLGNVLQLVDQGEPLNLETILEDLNALEGELGTLSGEVEAIESELAPE